MIISFAPTEKIRRLLRRLQFADWVIVGVLSVATFVVFFDTRHSEVNHARQQLEQQGDLLQRSLDTSLGRLDELMAANASFFYSSSGISDATFAEFNSTLLGSNPAAQQVQWLEWVNHADRKDFERRMARELKTAFSINEPGSDGRLSRAPVGADYLVIRFGLSRDSAAISRGLNVMFSAERRLRYRAGVAADTSLVSPVVPLHLSYPDGDKSVERFVPGFIVSRPVYQYRLKQASAEQRQLLVRGFITVLIQPEILLQSAVDPLLEGNVDAFLADRTEQGWRQFAHRSKSLPEPVTSNGPLFVSLPDDVLRTIKLLDQDWQIVVRPTSGKLSVSRVSSLANLFIGLSVVSLVLVALVRHRSYQERNEKARQQARKASEVAALNEELEQRVMRRTSQLAESNERLQGALNTLSLAQDELVRSEKLASLGALVAGVAHELNTPIGNSVTVVTTLEQLVTDFAADLQQGTLRRSRVSEIVTRSQEAVVLLSRNLHRAAELIANFKQVAVDQTSDRRREFFLTATLAEIVQTVNATLRGAQHQIVTDVPADILLDSFPGALGQVFINLLENARVHAFEPGVAGQINIDAHQTTGGRVLINFTDNGRGIPAEILPRIFDPFFTTRLGQGGSGLGLHIVYGIVTRTLGGRIRVTSQPGLGSIFVLDIPLQAPVEAKGAQVTEALPAAAATNLQKA